MDDTQFRLVLAEMKESNKLMKQVHESTLLIFDELAEMKESNKLMKAMVSELSQIKFELVNERIKRDSVKMPAPFPRDPNGSTGASTFNVVVQ